jgi:hypothetical protein
MKILFKLEKMLPLAFWVVLMFGFDSEYIAILTILAAIIHEGGHLIITLPFSKKRSSAIKNKLSGFRIKTSRLSYKEELLAALGGPLANFGVGLVFFSIPFENEFREYAYTFGLLNIMTMISNLLPIENYDGYRALSAALYLFFGDSLNIYAFLYWISFAFSSIMTFISLYLMLRLGEGYWIFAVFFSIMLSTVIKRQKETIYENNGDF